MTNSISIVWSTEDVKEVRKDLTDEQCMEVLHYIKKNHDASVGVNWEVLECVADILFG